MRLIKFFDDQKYLIIFFSFFSFLVFYYSVLIIKDISWVGFFSNDDIYLLEQLILKIKNSLDNFNSGKVEYGIEFYILKNIFNLINLNELISNNIYYYYILSAFHLFCFLVSCFFIFKILNFLLFKYVTKIIFIFSFLSYPPIIEGSVALKPDANIVLMFMLMSSYYYLNFLKELNIRYFFTSIFCAAFAFAIKFWGVFLLPAFIYTYYSFYKKKIFSFNFYFIKNIFIFLIFLALLKLIISYFNENYIVNDELFNLASHQYINYKFKSILFIIPLVSNETNFLIFSFCLIILYSFFLKLSFSYLFIQLSVSITSIFFIFWLLISLEFIYDFDKVIRSYFFFFKHVFLEPNSLESKFNNKLIFSLILLIITIVFFNFKKIKNNQNLFFFFIINVTLTLYYFISSRNTGNSIYYFYLLSFVFTINKKFIEDALQKKKVIKYVSLLVAFTCLAINLNEFYKKNYIKPNIIKVVQKKFYYYINNSKINFFCNKNFPTSIFINKNYKNLKQKDCENYSVLKGYLDDDSYIILNKDQYNQIISKYNKQNEFKKIEILDILNDEIEFKSSILNSNTFIILQK